jgi:senataxin
MVSAGYPVVMLQIQYRMHKAIAEYPCVRFYHGLLFTDESVITSGSHKKPYHDHPSGKFGPMVLHNLFYGRQDKEGTGLLNKEEVCKLKSRHRVASQDPFISTDVLC